MSKIYRAALVCATLVLAIGGTACGAGQDVKDESVVEEKRSSILLLYDAMVAEARERAWPIETASEEYLIVATEFELLSQRIRKRRIMKVVVLGGRGALNVRVEHQRDVGREAPEWVPMVDEAIAAKAKEEELEVARSIEKRFMKLQRRR